MSRAAAFLMLVAVSTGVACRRNAEPPVAAARSDSTLVIALERGPCYGFCPVYSVEVYESGRVAFTGTRNTRVVGAASDTIDATAVDSLKRLISASGFAAFDSAYVLDSPGCGQYATDMPVLTIRALVGSSVKTVRHELGCRGGPPAIQQIADQVDSLTKTSVWIKNEQEGAK